MDLISELPTELKERILECLPTRDVARTALLSTHWNDLWLRHGRLVFDEAFFKCISKYEGEKGISIINDILMLRVGPVKKFTLHLCNESSPEAQQSDLDRWCRFLSRNGLRELNLFLLSEHKLPSCILWCRTIKQLVLCNCIFDLPIRRCIFPSVTSLDFSMVEFSDNVKGIGYSIPNLEELSFMRCKGITNFEISSPKLENFTYFSVIGPLFWREHEWFTHYLKTIKTLRLSRFVECKNAEIATMTFPTAINLQVIELYDFNASCGEQLAFVLPLLQNSPNLCQLKITAFDGPCCDIATGTRLLEDPNSCIIKQDLKTLKTIMTAWLGGSTLELLFVKMLLSKSLALEKFVIFEDVHDKTATSFKLDVNSLTKLLRFPRASPKAQIIRWEHKGGEFEGILEVPCSVWML